MHLPPILKQEPAREAERTSCAGGKTTEAAMALAKLCFDTLMEEGSKSQNRS